LASSRRSGPLVAALLLLLSAGLAAQSGGPLVLAGRLVVVRGRDSTALGGAMVVAHRVGAEQQGPVDSAATDAAGRFRFVVARPESASVYVVSSRYAGIGYFSEPFGAAQRDRAHRITLAVYDTSAAGAPLAVSVRHVVVTRPEPDGSHKVLDIIQVRNGGSATRVGPDSLAPTWQMVLPAGITEFAVGEGEVSPSAVRREGGRLLVAAPFPPGEKQILVQYVLPQGNRALRIPIDQATAKLELLVEDSTVSPSGDLRVADPMEIEGHTFQHFTAELLVAGAAPELHFGRGAGQRSWIPIVAAGVALLAGLAVAMRRRRAPVAPAVQAAAGGGRDALLQQLVALDERYEGRESETPPAEWAAYREKRAALKADVARRLARS
jgi:hypothetical protein